MAVSVEAAFVLLDKASGPLKEIRRQALLTDKALRGMGSGGAGSNLGGSQIKTFSSALEDARKTSRALGDEIKNTGQRVDQAGGIFRRTVRDIDNWRKSLAQTHPVLTGMAAGLGGVLGGLKGLATAFPPLISLVIIAAPAIVALTGAVGALASSLGAAVGGGVLLGGGLLGSFAVGLGSIVSIAKPAIDATKKYEEAVKNLNTALASGSTTEIKARQQQLDALAKANPGVAKLADNVKAFDSAWKKATAPGRASFFKLANEGMETMRKLLPTLAGEANKNTAALQSSFQKILAPFLQSSQFKGLISGLGSIFRSNLPGFMTGVVNIFKGLSNILKIIAPDLDKVGGAFARFTDKFDKWTESNRGQGQIREMTKAFHAWMDLLKGIARLIGDIAGEGMGRGTGIVIGWAKAVNALADKLQTPAGRRGIDKFFDKTLADADQLAGLLKPIASDLHDIYDVFKPLGTATGFIIKNLPGPAVATLTAMYVGLKVATGATKGIKSVFDVFRGRGTTPFNPLYVTEVGLPSRHRPRARERGERGRVRPGELGPGGATAAGGTALDEAEHSGLGSRLKAKIPFARGVPELGAASVGGASVAGVLAFLGADAADPGVANKIVGAIQGADPSAPWLHLLGMPSITEMMFGDVTKQGASLARVQSGLPESQGGTQFNRGRPTAQPHGFSGTKGPFGAQPQGAPTIGQLGGTSGTTFGTGAAAAGAHKNPFQWIIKAANGTHTKVVAQLEGIVRDLPGTLNQPMKRALLQVGTDFDRMSRSAGSSLQNILSVSKTTTSDILNILPPGSAQAALAVSTNYENAADAIYTSMKDGVINTQQAMSAINSMLTKALNALGVPVNKSDVAAIGMKGAESLITHAQHGGTGASGNVGSGHGTNATGGRLPGANATGGRLPGEPRGDHLPLLGMGGNVLGIADGGELVVNRHTEAKADRMLARFGTRLSTLVDTESRPHFATSGRLPSASDVNTATGASLGAQGAKGQIVTASWYGSHGTGAGGLVSDVQSVPGYAELSNPPNSLNFSALGHLPFGTKLPVTYGGKTIVIPKLDVGAGGAGLNGHIRAIDLTGPAKDALNFPGLADVIVGNPAGISLAIGGGAGGGAAIPVPHLRAPRVKGRGVMRDIGQGVSNKVTAAANKYLQAHAPSGTGGGAVPGGHGTVQDPSGKPVAAWIEPILNWARQHGWGGSVSSGYRSLAEQTAIYNSGVRPAAVPGTSNHEGTQFPRGAVDVTDAAQLSQILLGSKYGQTLVWAGSKDPVHFSHPHGGSYAMGGRVPWYARGADFVANRPQVIGVGDAPGGERVTVTPKGGGRIGNQNLHVEIHKIEVNRKGDVKKIVDEELKLLAASIESRL